jgi:hypothetical protein
LDDLKTRAFSGVSFNAQTGDLILSFGNAQQPRDVGDGQSDDEKEGADSSSRPEPGPSQKGRKPGAAAEPYSVVITPTSQFYKKLIFEKVPQDIWLREIQLADLKAEFGAKKVNLIEGAAVAVATSPTNDPADKLAIAKAAANNPVVVRSLLVDVKDKTQELLKQYDILVRLCDKDSAAGVINELLIDKNKIIPAPGVAGFGLGIGIRKLTNTGEIEITSINGSGGAAATRQIRVGDIISTVDGVSLSDSSEQQVNEKLAGSQGTECVLRLKRRSGADASDEIITVKVRRIPPLPVKNNKSSNASVEDILQKLGWIGGGNKVWYNTDKDPRATGNKLIGGLFSLFSYNDRILSTFLSVTSCATNYVCMLNWIFLIALRLNNSEPSKFTYGNILELITNIYASVYGFVETEQVYKNYFITIPFNSIKETYIQRTNTNLLNKVFGDTTLAPIVTRIKGELQRSLDDSKSLPTSQPVSASSSRSASPSPSSNVSKGMFMGGGHKKKTRRINRRIDGGHHTIKKHSNRESEHGNKVTRRRHNKLNAKGRVSHIKTLRSARASGSV